MAYWKLLLNFKITCKATKVCRILTSFERKNVSFSFVSHALRRNSKNVILIWKLTHHYWITCSVFPVLYRIECTLLFFSRSSKDLSQLCISISFAHPSIQVCVQHVFRAFARTISMGINFEWYRIHTYNNGKWKTKFAKIQSSGGPDFNCTQYTYSIVQYSVYLLYFFLTKLQN